jgi:hypothetical protein
MGIELQQFVEENPDILQLSRWCNDLNDLDDARLSIRPLYNLVSRGIREKGAQQKEALMGRRKTKLGEAY